MKAWIRNYKKILVFVIYAGITFSLLFFHENWRDEAQTWLLARDCSISELIYAMKYEGHFLLWYFILMPFAKLGFPYGTTNIISWLISCLSVWLILRKAPFTFEKSVLLIFTFPLLYLYPVISRCYCLIPLAIVLMSIFYKDRKDKPLRYFLSIILLLNTHVIMAGMVAVVCIDYLIELYGRWGELSDQDKQNTIFSILITVFLIFISIYPLSGCLTANQEIKDTGNITIKYAEVLFFSPINIFLKIYQFITSFNFLFGEVCLIIAIILLIQEVRYQPDVWLRIYLCVLWQCLIYVYIYSDVSPQKGSALMFIVLYYKWIYSQGPCIGFKGKGMLIKKELNSLLWSVLLMINIINGGLFLKYLEIPYSYSNAFKAAQFVNNNLCEDSVILNGSLTEYTSSVIPFVTKNCFFYHVPGKVFFSYTVWNKENHKNLSIDDIKKLPSIFKEGSSIYLMHCSYQPIQSKDTKEIDLIKKLEEQGILTKVFSTGKSSISLEDYTIYKLDLTLCQQL